MFRLTTIKTQPVRVRAARPVVSLNNYHEQYTRRFFPIKLKCSHNARIDNIKSIFTTNFVQTNTAIQFYKQFSSEKEVFEDYFKTEWYKKFAQHIQHKNKWSRVKYWSAFVGLSLLGTAAAEIALQSAGALPMQGLVFLMITSGTATLSYLVMRLGGGGKRIAEKLGGKLVNRGQNSQTDHLLDLVKDVSSNAMLPETPPVYLIPTKERNAFAAGFTPTTSVIAVTRGLLDSLTPAELRAVLGHEVGHIVNGDCTTGLHLVAINMGFYGVFRLGMEMLRSRTNNNNNGKGKGNPLGAILALIGVATYALGILFRMAVSRSREFEADACSVAFVGNNRDLASALAKIADPSAKSTGILSENKEFYSHLYIDAPTPSLSGSGFFSLLSTHPPIDERIKKLKGYTDDYIRKIAKNTTKYLPPK